MSVSNENVKETYNGNGSTIYWPITFEYADPEHIAVYLTDDDGVTGDKLESDYTVDEENERVIYPDPMNEELILPEGWKITLKRETPLIQNYQPSTQSFNPADIEPALDKTMMAIAEIKEENSRTIKANITEDGADYTLPSPAQGLVIGWDLTDGTRLVNYTNPGAAAAEAEAFAAEAKALVEGAGSTIGQIQSDLDTAESKIETLETEIEPAKLNFDVTQTVYAGSVDEDGKPSFLTAGTGLSVNLSASVDDPVIIVFDYGINKYGTVCFSHEITANIEGAWSDLPVNETCYLYEDRNVLTGEFTRGYSLLAPNYVDRGNPATTDDQHTFRIDKRKMYVGDGSEASVVQRVFVGECTTNADSVTSVICYAIQGKYDSGWFNVASNQEYSKNYNIGSGLDDLIVYGWVRTDSTKKKRLINNLSSGGYSGLAANNAGEILAVLNNLVYLRTSHSLHPSYSTGVNDTSRYPDVDAGSGEARIFVKRGF
jgi:hypothetical protein